MTTIVSTKGSPLHAAVVSTRDLAGSVAFYRDQIGLSVLGEAEIDRDTVARLWGFPPTASAHLTVLGDGRAAVGRIHLVDFSDDRAVAIHQESGQRCYGLNNLNFYTDRLPAAARALQSAGCRPWSEPIFYDVGAQVGAPTELMLDGPDNVMLNLVELTTTDENTRVGQMRRYVRDDYGYNVCGFTPVVTTQHCVKDIDAAAAFYEDVLLMGRLVDTVMDSAEQNRFMEYPPDTRSRIVFMQGNHMFGKVALIQPLNYTWTDTVPRAHPPNIGYVAQTFIVGDLTATLERARAAMGDVIGARVRHELPTLGLCESVVVRVPGSGGYVQLIECA